MKKLFQTALIKLSPRRSFIKKAGWISSLRFFCFVLLASCAAANSASESAPKEKATLYIIGDSTVKNGQGNGGDGLWGWGNFIPAYFDSTKLQVENHAIGGRSSRTFLTEGRWDKIMASLKPGDFVLIQFGHNDGGAINDTLRARGTIKGNSDESQEIDNLITKKHEVVRSYGWYLRGYIQDAKAKGAIPIVLSLVPRNIWKDGSVVRASDDYGKWAAEAAESGGAYFVDLNEIVARHYEKAGEEKVKTVYFLEDHTHTNEAGARLNASSVVEGLLADKEIPLNRYLAADAKKKLRKE